MIRYLLPHDLGDVTQMIVRAIWESGHNEDFILDEFLTEFVVSESESAKAHALKPGDGVDVWTKSGTIHLLRLPYRAESY